MAESEARSEITSLESSEPAVSMLACFGTWLSKHADVTIDGARDSKSAALAKRRLTPEEPFMIRFFQRDPSDRLSAVFLELTPMRERAEGRTSRVRRRWRACRPSKVSKDSGYDPLHTADCVGARGFGALPRKERPRWLRRARGDSP